MQRIQILKILENALYYRGYGSRETRACGVLGIVFIQQVTQGWFSYEKPYIWIKIPNTRCVAL